MRLRLPEAEKFDRLLERLGRRLAIGPALAGKAVTVDAGRRQLVPEELRALETVLLEQHGASLLQVIDGREAATEAGGPVGASTEARALRRIKEWERSEEPARLVTAEPLLPRASQLQEGAGEAILVKRTLRSGQRVRHNGSVVILGDVNPGAEVVAAGDIVIMGTLRGVAHAGAAGDTEAIVAAFRLQPTQLRISSVIGRAPDRPLAGLEARWALWGGGLRSEAPEVARVRDGVVIIERYQPSAADLA